MKILLGPAETAGYYVNLTKGFKKLGIHADYLSRALHHFNYEEPDSPGIFIGAWRKIWQLRANTPRTQFIKKVWYILLSKFLDTWIVFTIAKKYDVLIFGFGETYTNSLLELIFYKILGKKIIFMFHGSDSRPPYINGALIPIEERPMWRKIKVITRRQKIRLYRIERYADYIFNFISTSHFLEKKFISSLLIGLPYDLNHVRKQARKSDEEKPVKILHSPSNNSVKGTREILAAIERLRTKGYRIELIMIQNMPNKHVLEQLACCDFVIDQIYSDTPMAGFATEAAHFEKPAVVGGYFVEQIRDYYQEDDIPPSLYVHPDHVEEAIEKLIADVDYRIELGRRAYEFVKSRWLPEQVAERYLQVIRGEIPLEWWCDPQSVHYLHGMGMPEWRTKEIVRGLVERYGPGALHLQDKPSMERAFLEFAAEDADSRLS